MSTFMSWLFHRRRTDDGSPRAARTLGPRTAEARQEQRVVAWTTEGGPLFVDFEALAHRLSALLDGLTPVSDRGAFFSFIGTGITDPSRYEDAAAAFNRLRPRAPVQEGALIQVFKHQLREESRATTSSACTSLATPCPSGA